MKPGDPFNLERFVEAQNTVCPSPRVELAGGRKRSHWMWFVFPQIVGLGSSSMAVRFGLSGADEARAFLDHAILGPRLEDLVGVILGLENLGAHHIFGSPDDTKFRSHLTLFAVAAPDRPLFAEALQRYFAGQTDPLTINRMA